MCEISPSRHPLRSFLIAAKSPQRGESLGQHLIRHDREVRCALPNEVSANVWEYQPDCTLIAAKFADGTDGIALCRAVKALPGSVTKCILLLPTDFRELLPAFYADASGYLYEDALAEEIEIAFMRLAVGERYLPLAMIQDFLMSTQMPDYLEYIAPLSKREREVFRYTGYGYKTTEIASHFFVTDKTVETHKMHIMHKLGINSSAELRANAMQVVQHLPPLHR